VSTSDVNLNGFEIRESENIERAKKCMIDGDYDGAITILSKEYVKLEVLAMLCVAREIRESTLIT
jgi:hypothetical protein